MSGSHGSSADGVEVVDLARSHMAEAVDLLARGMRDNPVHVAAYGENPERRERLIAAAFRSVFENFVHQESFGLRADGKLVAVTGVAPPGTCQPTIGQRLRMAPTMAKFGPRAAVRTGRWLNEWARHDPDEPHSHLGPSPSTESYRDRDSGRSC